MTRRTLRALDVYAMLLNRRYVTVEDVMVELEMDERTVHRCLRAIADRFPLVKETDAIGTGRTHRTAYYFTLSYKRGFCSEN